MTEFKYHFCPTCGRKIRGRFSHLKQDEYAAYEIYKFYCWRYVGFDEYDLCTLFKIEFEVNL